MRTSEQTSRVRPRAGNVVAPGRSVSLVVEAAPWPDPKLVRIEVELAYKATFLLYHDRADDAYTPMGMLLSPGYVKEEGVTRGRPEFTVVASQVIPVDHLGADGAVSVTLVVPEECPPTIAGVVTWVARARFHRRLGADHEASAALRVLGQRPDRLLAARAADATYGTTDDWLLLVGGPKNPAEERKGWSAEAPDRPQDVLVQIGTVVTQPGGPIPGTLSLRPDPVAFYRRTKRAWTKKAKRHLDDALQALPQRVEVDAVQVILECWRSSETGKHRVLQVPVTIAGPHTLSVGEARHYPFNVQVPVAARLRMNDDLQLEGPVPPTFYGRQITEATLDDFRWRVLGQVVTCPGQFDPVTERGTIPYSGDHLESPLWAATEVIVTDHDLDPIARQQQPDVGSTSPPDAGLSAQLSASGPGSTIMTIDDVFGITGKGVVVVGTLEQDVRVGDSIEVVGFEPAIGCTVVDAISVARKMVPAATAGEEAGLLLRGVTRQKVTRGAQVLSA